MCAKSNAVNNELVLAVDRQVVGTCLVVATLEVELVVGFGQVDVHDGIVFHGLALTVRLVVNLHRLLGLLAEIVRDVKTRLLVLVGLERARDGNVALQVRLVVLVDGARNAIWLILCRGLIGTIKCVVNL